MKNIYYSLLFFGMGLFASAQDMGGTPVEGLIPIKRTGIITQTATDAKATNSVARTAAVQDYISAPTGTSEEVGITEGQLSVSLSGAATYSIPIAVPPGINGVVPQVSLVYNSQGGNGLAGYGWNISGVSAITRIPRTQFHDGVVGGVNLDANDRFALDGQRLILKTGTIYGAAGAVYETENFSNLKITSQGTSSSDPNPSFKVEYPDGSVAMYGATTNSRSITTWGISYWENPQGVRISYNYLLANLANNNLTIEFIKYGTVGIITPINEIQFVYETRQRSEEYYMGGQRILMDKILSEIKVLGNNGVGFRNYVLGHNVTSLSHYQRLTSITEKTGNNTLALNPTVFAYEDNANTIKYTNITTDLELDGESFIDFNNGGKFVSGDFDGDEKMDFLIPFSVPEGWYNGYNLYTNITNGYSSNIGLKHNIGNYNEIFAVSLLNSKNELMSKQGWAVVSPIDEISYHNVDNPGYIFDVYAMQKPNNDPNSESQVYHQYNREVHFPLTTEAVIIYDRGLLVDTKHVEINKEIFSGDFNGDGFTDVIAIEINYSNSGSYSYGESDYRSVYFVDLKRNNTTNVLTYCGKLLKNISTHHHKIEIADVNGDGKMDIMYFEHQNLTVYTLDKNNQLEVLLNYKDDDIFLLERLCETTLGGFPYCFWAFSHPNLRDYNGDGKMDFGTIKGSFLSTGISYIHEPIKTISVSSDSASSELDRIEYNGFPTPIKIDFNNDGKQDVLIIYYKSQNQFNPDYGVTFRLLINDNGSLNKGNTYTSPYFPNVSGMPIFLSTKDPGKKLEIALLSGNKIHHFESLFDFSQEKLLRSITTGNGVRESISYLPLTKNAVLPDAVDPSDAQSGSVYTPLYSPDKYPLQNIESEETVDVVAKIEKQSSSVHKKQMYSYFGATSNMEGLGFLGFRAVMQTNWVSATDQWADYENTMMSSVSVASPYLRGANVANYSFKGFYPVSRIKFLAEANPPIDKEVSVNNSRTAEETLRASKRIRLLPGARIAPTTGNVFVAQIEPDANTSQTMVTDYITKSTAAYDSSLSDTKVYKLKNTQSNTYNALDNTSSETKITSYDDYNNPLESTSKIMNAGIEEQSTTTTIVYKDPILTATTTTPYLIGLPESKTQTVTTAIDTTTSDEVYEYTKNLLTKAKKKANNSDYIIEDNEYDIYGNITRKTITAPAVGLNPAPAARVTNYEYNPASPYNGRFLTKSTDIQGLETQYNYNPSSGVLDSITNPYNLTTSYLYDSWFKKTQTTDYLGKKNTYTYTRNGSISTIAATGDDGSYSFEVYDDLGRKTQTTVKDISGNNSTISYEYDIYDRQVKVFEPNNLNQWSETKYDQYGRIEESKSHTGKTVTMTYSGLTTTVVDESKTKTYTKNALGNVVSMTDTPGGIINYTYFANGNLKTTNYDGIETIIEQDDWGRKTYLNDPSAGEYRYAYNGFGETTSETTPNGTTTYNLDDFGRLSTKTIIGNKTNSQTTYNYDSTLKLLNSSVFEDLQAGTATTYTYLYDDSKRLYKTTEDTPNLAKFTKELKFDLFGRVDKETSIASLNGKSSSKTIKNTYKNGYPWQILTDETTPKVLWQTNTVNARGQLLTAQLGNGIAITNAYDDYGYSTQIKHDKTGTNPSNVMTLNTTFDPVKGNLKTRTNNMFGQWSEDFTNSYDSQDRLTSYKNALGATEYQRYDDKGKITENSIGFYNYTQTAYQNSSVTLKLGVKTYYDTNAKRQQTIDYNTFKSPYEITAGNEKLSFTYNDNNDRSVMFYGGLQNDKLQRTNRKYYSADGSMEIKTNPGGIEFVTYIGGDGYSAPVVYKKAYNVYTTIPDQMLYLHRDYQGSILAITNDAGAVLEKRLFDAWGSLIQYWNIGGITTPPAESLGLVLDRGYTGHEHLQSVGLINMNGRLYDPKLHRFLQPDNNIQDPYNTQNYNRYGYVLNNPLKFTDPTGEDYIDNHDGRLGGPCLSCPPPVPAGYQGSAESWNSGWSIDRVGIGGSSVPGGANGFGGSGYYNGGSFIRGNVSLPDFVPPKGAIQLKEVIVYGKPRRKSSSAQGNGGGQGGGVNAIDLVDYGVGGLGEAKNLMSYLWKSSSNASQWRAAYQASKTLGVGASVLKNGVSPALSKIGRNLTYAAVAVTAVKVISTGQVHASDVLALSMTALGATGFGVPIATAFFAADLLTLAITGQSIGNHLDKVVGQPLIDFGYGRN